MNGRQNMRIQKKAGIIINLKPPDRAPGPLTTRMRCRRWLVSPKRKWLPRARQDRDGQSVGWEAEIGSWKLNWD